MNIYRVDVEFPYMEDGKRYGQGLYIIFQSPSDHNARLAAARWAINRQHANDFEPATCIKLSRYSIGEPEPNGYIKSGIGLGYVLEWKYDTSPFYTPAALLAHLMLADHSESGRY